MEFPRYCWVSVNGYTVHESCTASERVMGVPWEATFILAWKCKRYDLRHDVPTHNVGIVVIVIVRYVEMCLNWIELQ